MKVTASFCPFRDHVFAMLPSSSNHETRTQVSVTGIVALGFLKELAQSIKRGLGFGDLQGI